MDSDRANRTKSFKKKQKSRGSGPTAPPRRLNRRNSLQLPKGVRVSNAVRFFYDFKRQHFAGNCEFLFANGLNTSLWFVR